MYRERPKRETRAVRGKPARSQCHRLALAGRPRGRCDSSIASAVALPRGSGGPGPAGLAAADHRHGLDPAVGPAGLERASKHGSSADNKQLCPQQAGARADRKRDMLQRSIKVSLGIISEIFFS